MGKKTSPVKVNTPTECYATLLDALDLVKRVQAATMRYPDPVPLSAETKVKLAEARAAIDAAAVAFEKGLS